MMLGWSRVNDATLARMPRSLASVEKNVFHSQTATMKRGLPASTVMRQRRRPEKSLAGCSRPRIHCAAIVWWIAVLTCSRVTGNSRNPTMCAESSRRWACSSRRNTAGPLIGCVAADAFKHAEAVLHSGAKKRHNPFAGRFQRVINPYVASSSHGLPDAKLVFL